MSIVSLLGIEVLNNPAKFTDPYEFEITFECLEPLREDLEWKLTYVGSSRSSDHDQELDSILVGPVPVGVNKFLFQADPPSPDLIPASELVSVTVILLSCSYADREFVRVGYYVNNEYDTEELREMPPAKVLLEHVARNILAEKPRVTRFNIVWDTEESNTDQYPLEQEIEEEDDDEEELVDENEDDDVDSEIDTANGDHARNSIESQRDQTESEVASTTSTNIDGELEEEDVEEDIGEDEEDEEDLDEDVEEDENMEVDETSENPVRKGVLESSISTPVDLWGVGL